jgi:IS5 family transposase
MAIKQTGQLGLADAVVQGAVEPLDRIDKLVRWYRFDKLLGRLRDDGVGRPAWPVLLQGKKR